jgi:hypothetical protein
MDFAAKVWTSASPNRMAPMSCMVVTDSSADNVQATSYRIGQALQFYKTPHRANGGGAGPRWHVHRLFG